MPKRRSRKPGTVSGLSGDHLGMTVRIDGTDYHLTHVQHRRTSVRILGEWDDPDDDTVYRHGDREFPAGTPCTVVDWRFWFRPSGYARLIASLHFSDVIAPDLLALHGVSQSEMRTRARAYVDEVTWDPVKMREIRAWNKARRETEALDGTGS
jgi:hypothetical protein